MLRHKLAVIQRCVDATFDGGTSRQPPSTFLRLILPWVTLNL